MRVLDFLIRLSSLIGAVYSQSSSQYCDPLTSICYSSITSASGVSFRVACPAVTKAPFDAILQVVAPIENGWVGFSWGGTMTFNPLTIGWVNENNGTNGANVMVSSRWAL